jgi:hypothetical protein
VRTLVDLALALEHRRGHVALYGGFNQAVFIRRMSDEAAEHLFISYVGEDSGRVAHTQLRLTRPLAADLRRS